MLQVLIAVVALVVILTSSAVRAAPCADFTDVEDTSPFCVSVSWMKNRGITLGCAATLYCPSDFVTRLQMAAFLYRLGFQNTFLQGGNAFGATAVLGTSDNQSLDIRVNNARVLRFEPNAISPNVIGGHPNNSVTAGVRGATIAGGGVPTGDTDPDFASEAPNRVTDAYGTVGGGYNNQAGDDAGTTTDRAFATVGGGAANVASGSLSTVGGGIANAASGTYSTVGGGYHNDATGNISAVGGGNNNTASGPDSTVVGGEFNVASGDSATVAGGSNNIASGNYAWAGGRLAGAVHHGAFVWADSSLHGFDSSVHNEFAVRATGGARFVTAIDGFGTPTRAVGINPNGELEFGAVTRQMLNLYGATWAIGVQDSTQYFRTGNHFAWYLNGFHSNAPLDPGGNGSALMTLTNGPSTSGVIGTLRAQVITATSDRARKREFAAVDGREVLERVAALPIATWAYDNEPGVRHMGPSGQDFRAAFALGHDDKAIATVDADGVALAAIQGLNAKVAEQAREIGELKRVHAREIAELRRMLEHVLATR